MCSVRSSLLINGQKSAMLGSSGLPDCLSTFALLRESVTVCLVQVFIVTIQHHCATTLANLFDHAGQDWVCLLNVFPQLAFVLLFNFSPIADAIIQHLEVFVKAQNVISCGS
jgi:hypothetical protein